MQLLRGTVTFLIALSSAALCGESLTLQRVASGLDTPIFVNAPSGDTARLFVSEQNTGRIRIINLKDGTVNATPFLTIPNITHGGEHGLLGMAFHPVYASNGFFFVNYTDAAGDTVIARYKVSASDPNIADPAPTVILTVAQPQSNHNGGWLGFGRDGFLYIALGDGGGSNDVHGTIGFGQDRTSLLGKILRIDVDNGTPYAIPDGNPFKGDAARKQEIWTFGLRNPWRCSIDRNTGDLWIGDVGQADREEVDFVPAGAGGLNFGWRPREGGIQNPAYPSETPVTPATGPVRDYSHQFGVAVVSGYVYRGNAIPSLQGTYFYADFGFTNIWSLRYSNGSVGEFTDRTQELNPSDTRPLRTISSFGEDAAGELYVCDHNDGEIFKIVARAALPVPTPPTSPPTNTPPVDPGLNAQPLNVNALKGAARFDRASRDTVTLTGVLPGQPENPNLVGTEFVVDVGGARTTFTLGANGRGVSNTGSVRLKLRPAKRDALTGKPVFAGGPLEFRVDIRKASLNSEWRDEGADPLRAARGEPMSIVVVVNFLGVNYATVVTAKYTGKPGKSGVFKQ